MTFIEIYMFSALGIVTSIALPILRKSIPKPVTIYTATGEPSATSRFWEIAKPYASIGAFSLLTALLIVAFAGETLTDWRAAFLLGYAWDSTVQKIR